MVQAWVHEHPKVHVQGTRKVNAGHDGTAANPGGIAEAGAQACAEVGA